MAIITATFETRRDAELAVDHLVQEHELDREDIVVGTDGNEDSVGTETSGPALAPDTDDDDQDEAAANGSVLVTVTVDGEDLTEAVQELLEEFGAGDVSVEG